MWVYCFDARLKQESCQTKRAAQSKETTMSCDLKMEKRKSDDLSAEVKRLREKILQVRARHFLATA